MNATTPNYPTLRPILLFSLCLAVIACSGGSGSGFAPIESAEPANGRPYQLITIELDFTCELSQQGLDPGELTGLAADSNTGERFILNRDGEMFSFGLFGNFLNQTTVQAGMADSFGGLEWIAQSRFHIATNDNSIYSLDLNSESTELVVSLPEEFGKLENVASDAASNLVFAINSIGEKRLVTIDADGTQNTAVLDSRMTAYPITGMHAFDGSLFLSSTGHSDTPEQAVVMELDYDGVFQRAWSLPAGTPAALLIENSDPIELAIATSDSANILFFEAPAPGSKVMDNPLEFMGYEELGFDQPSGVDYAAERDSLIFITDFAEVHELADGEDPVERFELEEAPGSFEALAYSAAEIHLLMSDESTPQPMVRSYNLNGTLNKETTISDAVGANTVFEAMDIGPQTQTLYLISANIDERKQLLRIAQGEQITTVLPETYDDFAIVGVDISDDETQAIFVTDERIDDGTLLSGLAISIDLNTLEERWRLAIAVPAEDGDVIGLAAPSGIAVDRARSRLYVSSDVDESMLAVYELP